MPKHHSRRVKGALPARVAPLHTESLRGQLRASAAARSALVVPHPRWLNRGLDCGVHPLALSHLTDVYRHSCARVRTAPRCAGNQWRCTNGQCIPKSYKCDSGYPDCRDGSDERGCHDTTAG